MTTGRNLLDLGSEYSWTLTNGAAAVKGQKAVIDTATGLLTVVSALTTLLPVGRFAETLTGDGTKKCRVTLPMGVTCEIWNDDTNPNDVGASNIGSTCYMKDGTTVSTSSAGRSAAGIVVDFLPEGTVAVLSGLKITGATGATGNTGTVATIAALKAIAAGSRSDGMRVQVIADGSNWIFNAANADALVSDGSDQLTIAPTVGTGIWIRNASRFDMRIAIDKTMADAAVLSTIPTGYTLLVDNDPHWVVVVGWTGGAASAIGISTSNAAGNTKGDILGGAAGDVTATLGTAGAKAGTAGAKMGTIANRRALLLVAADTLRFDRIASAFTAGSGYVDIPVVFALAK